jgi:hypothetical protein
MRILGEIVGAGQAGAVLTLQKYLFSRLSRPVGSTSGRDGAETWLHVCRFLTAPSRPYQRICSYFELLEDSLLTQKPAHNNRAGAAR